MLLDPKFKVTVNDSTTISADFMRRLYNVSVAIEKDHNININQHNVLYNRFWNSLMQKGVCSAIV